MWMVRSVLAPAAQPDSSVLTYAQTSAVCQSLTWKTCGLIPSALAAAITPREKRLKRWALSG